MVGALSRAGPDKVRTKVEAKKFEADLCSFQELMNIENNPTMLSEALQRLQHTVGGPNFAWQKVHGYGDRYGGAVDITYELILWYEGVDVADEKTRITSGISFMHCPGVAYIYQPVVPVVSLMISPRTSMRPMFDMDPRSFHTFKLAWRHYLDFGVSDYRIIVGDQLERWTERCKKIIERPLNTVYWLMLMVGSYYREVLVTRRVLSPILEPPTTTPVICVDSFVALSTLLFSPERQVLFAGIDPTPSYLQWLQYIGDQHADRKVAKHRRTKPGTLFETNEFLDVAIIVVYYGRIQQKVKESTLLSWVANPPLVKSYIAKYMQDNRCGAQLEQAVRLYTVSCAAGRRTNEEGEEKWYCWNGLHVCDIGVPMPSTQATFLSPFVVTRPVALHCSIHGPEAVRQKAERKANSAKKEEGDREKAEKAEKTPVGGSRRDSDCASGGLASPKEREKDATTSSRRSRFDSLADRTGRSSSRGSRPSLGEACETSTRQTSTEDDSEESSDSQSTMGGFGQGSGTEERFEEEGSDHKKSCDCMRYIPPPTEAHKMRARRRRKGGANARTGRDEEEMEELLQALGEFDVLHGFAAVLAGGLNLAKHFIRLHFSIDPKAYEHLPMPAKMNWQDGMMPWYREFHRPDVYGRSRYCMVLERLVHGLLGDGFTSGVPMDCWDILRVGQDAKDDGDRDIEAARLRLPSAVEKATSLAQNGSGGGGGVGSVPSAGGGGGAIRRTSTMPRPASTMQAQGRADLRGENLGGLLGIAATSSEQQQRIEVGGSAPCPSRPPRAQKGIVGEIALWSELYESESLYNHRTHFETFTQWCHSAHLVPFLQRCYRRCGIAGLLPDKHSGGHKYGADPSHPLVLPTMADFCYGHCYPIHRVMQYFYGGVEHIMCSIDDPQAVEADRMALGLISGQERLNNQCWFQLSMPGFVDGDFTRQSQFTASKKLTDNLLQQLEDYIKDSNTRASKQLSRPSSPPGESSPRLPFPNSFRGSTNSSGGGVWPGIGSSNNAGLRDGSIAVGKHRTSKTTIGLRTTLTAMHGSSTMGSCSQERPQGMGSMAFKNSVSLRNSRIGPGKLGGLCSKKQRKSFAHQAPRLGLLVPTDPFFWFCQQNYALYVFPASGIPRQLMNEPGNLLHNYSDFVSRSGSPEPLEEEKHGDEEQPSELAHRGRSRIPDYGRPQRRPPSVNVCQPTDLYASERHRWEVKKECVDEARLILGDDGWWPGASGHRFTFEARCDKPDRFARLNVVPTVQLLYIEHTMLPPKAEAKRLKKMREGEKPGGPMPWCASSSSESDDETELSGCEEGKALVRESALQRRRRKLAAKAVRRLVVPGDDSSRLPGAGAGGASGSGGGSAAAASGDADAADDGSGVAGEGGAELMLPPLLPVKAN